MKKISDDEINNLADDNSEELLKVENPKFDGKLPPSFYRNFTKGYRIAEAKHLKTIKKLQTLIKQHRVIIDALCNEEKK